jgi:hypothetical protein
VRKYEILISTGKNEICYILFGIHFGGQCGGKNGQEAAKEGK